MFKLEKDTQIEIRIGMQSVTKAWNELAFVYIGSKHVEPYAKELQEKGCVEWDGVMLFHPNFKA